jgi:monofunctional glycosyltransferase
MTDAKRRTRLRWTLGLLAVAAVWLFGVWPPPVWWRTHWPRCTAMMRLHEADGGSASACPPVRPTALREVSPLLQRMVIIGEDSRFRTHHGIDPAEIADALQLDRGAGPWATLAAVWRRRDRLRGASTITQQLAKNLYLSPSRSPLRKAKEAVTALRLELALPKDRILEMYLGVVELGPGVWGVDAASRRYFGVSPAQLDELQAAALAATLPHPRTSNPAFRPERMLARRDLILARYHGGNVYIPPEEDLDSLLAVPVVAPMLPPLPDTIVVPVLGDSGKDTTGRDTLPKPDTTVKRDSVRR